MSDLIPAVPPLDYSDSAVRAVLEADPRVSDAWAICDYLAAHTSASDAAREYGIDCALGELASTDPELARRHMVEGDQELRDRAESYVADNGLLDGHASLSDYRCLVARTMIEFAGEDELFAAVDALWTAYKDGKFPDPDD